MSYPRCSGSRACRARFFRGRQRLARIPEAGRHGDGIRFRTRSDSRNQCSRVPRSDCGRKISFGVPCRRIASSAFLRLTDPKSIECTSDQVLSAAVSGRPCFRKLVNSLQAVLNFLPMKKIGRRGPSTRSTGFVRYALASARHPRVSPTFSTDGHLIRDAARRSRWGRILVHEVNNSSP